MQFFKTKKGFTLIELLVVIAIIGILAAIVLVSLGAARDRARVARIQSGMAQFRALAEMANTADLTFANVCSTSTGAYQTEKTNLFNDIVGQGGTVANCEEDADGYCFSSLLPADPGAWCVDSVGNSNDVSAATHCATATTTCQ